MKRYILLFLSILLLWSPAFGQAADIKIAWDANTETDLAGYRVYYGISARTGTDPKVCPPPNLCGYQTKTNIPIGTTFTINGLTAGTTYWLSLTAYDTAGNESAFSVEVSGPAILYVAPSIATQPVGVTASAGQTATFTVVATGTPPLSYQWRKNGVNISGAVAASYTTPPIVVADNGASFTCVVTNNLGSVTSSGAVLTVNMPPANPSNFRLVP
jgi:hypothetical protein